MAERTTNSLPGTVTVTGYGAGVKVIDVETTGPEGGDLLRAINKVKGAFAENRDLTNLDELREELAELLARVSQADATLRNLGDAYDVCAKHGVNDRAIGRCPNVQLVDGEGTIWWDQDGEDTLVSFDH